MGASGLLILYIIACFRSSHDCHSYWYIMIFIFITKCTCFCCQLFTQLNFQLEAKCLFRIGTRTIGFIKDKLLMILIYSISCCKCSIRSCKWTYTIELPADECYSCSLHVAKCLAFPSSVIPWYNPSVSDVPGLLFLPRYSHGWGITYDHKQTVGISSPTEMLQVVG